MKSAKELNADMMTIAKLKKKISDALAIIAPDEKLLKELEAEFRAEMLAADSFSLKGKPLVEGGMPVAVSLTMGKKPVVVDWALYDAFAIKTKSPDLFQRRAHEAAIMLRFDAGKKIPGVELQDVVSARWAGVK